MLRAGGSDSRFDETSFAWRSVETPVWLRFTGRYRDADINSELEVSTLADLSSVVSNSDGDKLFVNAAAGIAVFDIGESSDTLPEHASQVAHSRCDRRGDSEGLGDAVLHWDSAERLLYAISANGIWLANNYDSSNGHLEHCSANEETFTGIHDVLNSGNFFYVLGVCRTDTHQ